MCLKSQGGIKAVMWTDVFQAICMFGSFLAIIIKGNYDAGGHRKVFDLNYEMNRIEIFKYVRILKRLTLKSNNPRENSISAVEKLVAFLKWAYFLSNISTASTSASTST
jgi:Na+/proline symporter